MEGRARTPKAREPQVTKISSGSKIGAFWLNCKTRRRCGRPSYVRLLTHPVEPPEPLASIHDADRYGALLEALGVDAGALLVEIAAGDTPLDPDTKPELVVYDVLAWFERRVRARKQRETTQRLREAPAQDDVAALLLEKQRELEAKRAQAAAPKPAGAPR